MFGRTNDPLIIAPLEQAGHRGYARPILCFPLNPSYDQDEVVRVLREGLEATKEQVPYLAAEVVRVDEPEAKQKGCLTLEETDDLGELHVKKLDKSEFPLSYDEFRAKNFPINLLKQDVVSPLPLFPKEGDRVPVFAAQANFIEGGLLLSICSYHLVADGFSIAKYFQIWAQNCRKLQTSTSRDSVFLSSSAFDSAPLFFGHLSDPNKCDIKHHSELVLNDTSLPQSVRIPSTQRNFCARIWHFTPDALSRLRVDASVPGQPKVSAEEAVAALIWRCTVAAQLSPDAVAASPQQISHATLAISSRMRTFPPLAPDYMGCPLVYASAAAPLADLVHRSESDEAAEAALLQTLARKVKSEIESVTAHRVANLVNTLQSASVPDYERLAPVSWSGLGQNSLFISKWNEMPFYEADWGAMFSTAGGEVNGEEGAAASGYCERIRTVAEGMLNGVQMILPTVPKKKGVNGKDGLEVMMGMEAGKPLETLENDPVWLKYALPA
ncbi:Enoyl- hydratase isomerase [Lasiodiplodia theobromae]|uniref:Enoyl- hydratase isomerase n=1 Tax=Lasiodiplodia theobromae TaxID=45133 RepID=UPI0015C3AEA6|nr:Enoyl- hydratase isomerase [Lasiodiplodia theobromae]KAF4539902.1 Enoyl- hydratase isomerase [Lasiodiplodia theobromae]